MHELPHLLTSASDQPVLDALRVWMDKPLNRVMAARPWHWKTAPMPEQSTMLPLDFRLSAEETVAIRFGVVPVKQEQKWFAWFAENTLHQYRSWTGFCIDRVCFMQDGRGLQANHAIVNRDPEQYQCTDDGENAARIEMLVRELVERNIQLLRSVGVI